MQSFVAGKYCKQSGYRSFLPDKINRDLVIDDLKLVEKLTEASHLLGELNAYAQLVPDISLFIKMHTIKEATMSSKIEGTKTEIAEALLEESDVLLERRDDWHEVKNYITAMNQSILDLEELPISWRLLCKAHKILMRGSRGENKLPGEMRKSQNWIGGSKPSNAFFVPPHHEDLPDLLSDWEKFWHNDCLKIPTILKIAMMHYQFETIHPFLDGNGRVGRMLISLQLIDSDLLTRPALYLSDYFEQNRLAYYDSLTLVRTNNDLGQWFHFFLDGIVEASKNAVRTLQAVLELRDHYLEIINGWGRAKNNGLKLLNLLLAQPIVSSLTVRESLNTNAMTANRLLIKFEDSGLLKEITGQKRNRLYSLHKYLEIFA